ncbi:MAG: glycerol-3-phosphate acyltransferase [Anaerolineae bacterium]
MVLNLVLTAIGAYLLGSIPPGIFWSHVVSKIDPRDHGSGRTGGTNVWRSAGFLPALLTAISDALKGAAAIWLAKALGVSSWGQALAGTVAVLGHNHSLFLKFQGGAGTATSLGAAAALWPLSLPILVLSGVAAGLLVGHASVASILVAILLPITFALHGTLPYAIGFGLPVMALTLLALRPNIHRLLRGEERFLPIYRERPPLVRLSLHPTNNQKGD